jgi:hypothetical protein
VGIPFTESFAWRSSSTLGGVLGRWLPYIGTAISAAVFQSLCGPTSMSAYIGIPALVLVGFGVFIAIAAFVFDLRRRKHRGVSREEFVRAFAQTGTPDIPEAVFRFYTRSWFFGNLTIAPDDSLEHVLNKGEQDVEDDAVL